VKAAVYFDTVFMPATWPEADSSLSAASSCANQVRRRIIKAAARNGVASGYHRSAG